MDPRLDPVDPRPLDPRPLDRYPDPVVRRHSGRPWLIAALAIALLFMIGLFAMPSDDRPSTAQVPADSSTTVTTPARTPAPPATTPAPPAATPTTPAPSR
jgi:hypothetical protein